jgi:hypothetical protein
MMSGASVALRAHSPETTVALADGGTLIVLA